MSSPTLAKGTLSLKSLLAIIFAVAGRMLVLASQAKAGEHYTVTTYLDGRLAHTKVPYTRPWGEPPPRNGGFAKLVSQFRARPVWAAELDWTDLHRRLDDERRAHIRIVPVDPLATRGSARCCR